ncbi:tyrosine-type recombinase/integrase [Rubrobacter tropicus]|uniref:Tyrosine-type recombinase/integrase n=1 Tax=Rubrobacter tropicus TaxID=2653851 RepID=A0A6G8Q9H5_9ACTN|nr:tyrosine-type recombinase/integrase [Rubrobacter tropicus]
MAEWLDSWLRDCLKPLVDAGKMTHSTFIRYEGIANNHLKPALGPRKLKDLTRAEVRWLYNEKGKTLSARSVDYVHVTLQKALSQAVRDDLIYRNVAEGERPRSSRERRSDGVKALSPVQVRVLLDAARGTRNEALYVVALHTGLRQGELLGLKWSDVDLDAGKLSVRRALKVTDHGLDFGPTKNKASRRRAPQQDRGGCSAGSQGASERRAHRSADLARRRSSLPEPRRRPDGPQQPVLPRLQDAPKARRARRLHVPRAASHVRHGAIQPGQAPQARPIAARSLVDHADDGHLLAPDRRHRRRRGRRAR